MSKISTKPPSARMSQIEPGERFYVAKEWDKDPGGASEHMRLFPGCKDTKGNDANSVRIDGSGAGTLANIPDEVPVLRVRRP
jgi:hypothetical protein